MYVFVDMCVKSTLWIYIYGANNLASNNNNEEQKKGHMTVIPTNNHLKSSTSFYLPFVMHIHTHTHTKCRQKPLQTHEYVIADSPSKLHMLVATIYVHAVVVLSFHVCKFTDVKWEATKQKRILKKNGKKNKALSVWNRLYRNTAQQRMNSPKKVLTIRI